MRTILYHGHFYQQRDQFCSALLIEDGLIIQCGNDEAILALSTPKTQMIDCQGKTGLPGFNDSHCHFYGSAMAAQTVDLYGTTSIDKIIDQAQAFLESHPQKDQTLYGRGWNQDYFINEKRLVIRSDLDRISTAFPIVFSRACGHVVSVNSKALEVLGLNGSVPLIEGGQIDLDDQGIPTGVFRENAIGLLDALRPALSIDDRVELLRMISRHANQYGITSVQTNDLLIGSDDGLALEEAYRRYAANQPTIRIYHQVSFSDLDALNDRINAGHHQHENDFNRYGPLKLFVDGSLGARTARLRQPYADDPSTQGIEVMSSDVLDAYVQTADQAKIQIAIHAIGDGAMTQVLDAYEKVIHKTNALRHGIVHCQITDEAILKRFKALDILPYVQPIFLHYDLHIVKDRVGEALASTSYAFGTMEKLGLHVAYGTDAPVEGFNVFHNLHCAINRQDLNAYPSEGFTPSERVDLETALDAYTIGSAWASFEETRKGRLLQGYLADLVLIDRNIFECPKDQIKDIKVDLTMVSGKIVYQR